MSATLTYPEPYRFSAGVLALLVHVAFFSLLYFGVRWQSQPPQEYMVEMWESLPNAEVAPEQPPTPPSRMEPTPPAKVVAPVSPPVKADIEVREKKSKKAKVKEKPAKKNEKKEKAAARAKTGGRTARAGGVFERSRKAEQERVRAEVNTATKVQVERYQDLIRNKIRRKRKKVADVPESAEAIFKVTLLPDGMLMDDPVLVKSSGFALTMKRRSAPFLRRSHCRCRTMFRCRRCSAS